MIPPIGWISNFLLASTFAVGHNAAKNVIFRVSSILLQYTIFKLLSYIAYRLTAYTSFLMLMEDFIQKLYYISSQGIQRHSWIVLVFLVLFPAAGFYDTCLWMLDAPGYIIKPTLIPAPSFSNQILHDAPYIVTIPGEGNKINLERSVSADLYTSNVTLVGTHLPISQEVVPSLQQLSSSNQPRIWLDNEGWSIGLSLGWPDIPNGPSCAPNSTDTQQKWSCHLNNMSAINLYTRGLGEPRVWWDTTTSQPDVLSPLPKENLWYSLGRNGSSAVMKQVFTLTKGQRRHTLLATAWKVTMQTSTTIPFQDDEILGLIQRTWNNDLDQVVNPEIQGLADEVVLAQTRGDSLSRGRAVQEPQPFAIRASVIELLNVVNPVNLSDRQFSALRFSSSNITLLRSETLSSSTTIQPFAPCSGSFANIATGGRVHDTTCAQHAPASGPTTTDSFKGQIDSSTIVILPDVLGRGDTNTSDNAFDIQGQSWLLGNGAYLDEIMASRAFILGGNGDVTQVAWQERVAAISYLQIILLGIPAVLAAFAWLLMAGNSTSYYKHSFLAAACATTHVSDNSCRRIGYLKNPPVITLKKARRHIVVGTPNGGTLTNVERDQVVAYSMITEPFTLPSSPKSGDEQGMESTSKSS